MRRPLTILTLLALFGLPSPALSQDDEPKETKEAKAAPADTDTPAPADQAQDPKALQARIDALEARVQELTATCTPPTAASSPESILELARRVRAMKSQNAAVVLSQLDARLALEIFARLDRRSSARILNVMPAPQAAKLLAGMAKRGHTP